MCIRDSFRGETIIGDLGESLRKKNYNVEEVVCYRKLPHTFSPKVIDGISTGLIIGTTFFSKETVRLFYDQVKYCLLYTSPSPRDRQKSRMPSSAWKKKKKKNTTKKRKKKLKNKQKKQEN